VYKCTIAPRGGTRLGVIHYPYPPLRAQAQRRESGFPFDCLVVEVSQKDLGKGGMCVRVKFRKNVWGDKAERKGDIVPKDERQKRLKRQQQ